MKKKNGITLNLPSLFHLLNLLYSKWDHLNALLVDAVIAASKICYNYSLESVLVKHCWANPFTNLKIFPQPFLCINWVTKSGGYGGWPWRLWSSSFILVSPHLSALPLESHDQHIPLLFNLINWLAHRTNIATNSKLQGQHYCNWNGRNQIEIMLKRRGWN